MEVTCLFLGGQSIRDAAGQDKECEEQEVVMLLEATKLQRISTNVSVKHLFIIVSIVQKFC